MAEQKSWFNRNWLWFIPVSGCLGIILLIVFGVGAAFFGVSKILNNATPVEYALEKVNENDRLALILGSPIEKNGFPNGNISFHNNDGEVDFSVPIKGSKGEAYLIVKGIKTNGEWIFEDLYVEIKETQEQVNLIERTLESI